MDMLPEKDIESPEPGDETPEPEATSAPQDEQPGAESSAVEPEAPAAEEASASSAPETEHRRPTFDEALGEMRQSLREEETKEKTGFGSGVKRLVQRIFRRKTAPLPEVTEARLDEFAIPDAPHAGQPQSPTAAAPEAVVPPEGEAEAPAAAAKTEEPATESTQFQDLVRNKITGALPGKESMEPLVASPATPTAASEDEALDFLAPGQTHLKEQPEEPSAPAGQSILTAIRGEEETESQEVSKIRQAALEDYVAEPDVEDVEAAAPITRRLRRGWRDMRPMDRTLLTAVLGVLAVVIVGGAALAAYQTLRPAPTAPPATPTASTVPIPISLTLPGLPAFPLGTGHVEPDGVWRPSGYEWLQGTEICRWVSLKYDEHLEAFVRTLKANDTIQLTMSDYSSITYKVTAIEQKPADQLQSIAPTTPSLLVILSKPGSATSFVVVAMP